MVSKREIILTKELSRRLQKKFPDFRIYSNKCPSRSTILRKKWTEVFNEPCPPLQPEIDIVIFEPPNPHVLPRRHHIRAIEIKCFEKIDGRINQSFYKGIEQPLALLQWGFDNVALWQVFDESFSNNDLRNYGCRTWHYIGVLGLPIEYTMIKLTCKRAENLSFQVVQADWDNNLRPIELLDIDSPHFLFSYTRPNPLVNEYMIKTRFTFTPQIGPREKVVYLPGVERMLKEVSTLRQFLLDWLPNQKSVLEEREVRRDKNFKKCE